MGKFISKGRTLLWHIFPAKNAAEYQHGFGNRNVIVHTQFDTTFTKEYRMLFKIEKKIYIVSKCILTVNVIFT